jgi:fructosamine-3-kinase
MVALSAAASEGLGRTVVLESTMGGGSSGGGGASTSAVVDKETGDKYFVKAASGELDMLQAEYLGVKAMADTKTIQVPTPIAFGQHEQRAFVLFEYLNFCGGGSQYELGVQLAKVGILGLRVHSTLLVTFAPHIFLCSRFSDASINQ